MARCTHKQSTKTYNDLAEVLTHVELENQNLNSQSNLHLIMLHENNFPKN